MVISHKKLYLIISLSILMLFFSLCSTRAENSENDEINNLVGRIAYIDGQLLRYVPEEDDWVVAAESTPFGNYDVLYSSEDAKAEIIMPNNTLMRIGKETQVQLIELKSELTEVEVSSGSARFYNNSSSTEIKATTPFGDLILLPEASCDLYLNDNQAEVIALKGSVDFTKPGNGGRHEVIAGSSSLIVTIDRVIAAAGNVDSKWNKWNADRDRLWNDRMQSRGVSEKYLPAGLQDEAYVLEEHGRWENVYYEGSYNYFWRPLYVNVGWTPFSHGRWATWHGDHTWVPYEPFGYVTHHYGNWVHVRNHWYWGPPVSRVMVSAGLPLFNFGFSWYPGRVGWIYSSINIGWFPLAHYETYYSHRYWGPRSRVRHGRHNYYYDKHRYRHYRHARVLRHEDLYRHNNYQRAGLRKVRDHNNYRGSAFASKKRYNPRNKIDRYKATNDRLRYKPQRSKTASIRKNNFVKTRSLKYNNRPLKRSISKTVKTASRKDRLIVPGKNRAALNKKRPANIRTDSVRKRLSRSDPKKRLTEKRSVVADGNKRKKNAARYTNAGDTLSRKITKNRNGSDNTVSKRTKKGAVQIPGKSLRERRSVKKVTTLPGRTSQRNTPNVIKQKTNRTVKTGQTRRDRVRKGSTFNVVKQNNRSSLKTGRALKPVQARTVRTSQRKIRTPSVSKQKRSVSSRSISSARSRSVKQKSYGRSIASQNRSYQSKQSRNYQSRQSSRSYARAGQYGNARGRRY